METQPPQPRALLVPPAPPALTRTDILQSAAAHPRTRVLCVDDSPDMADVLARLVRAQPDFEVAGTLGSAEGLMDEVARRRVDVVVLDLTMPGPDPISAIRALAESTPGCRVIAYSGYDDAETRAAVRAAGACELVSKTGDPTDLIRAIRRAANLPGRPAGGGN
ncbi:hypothetical protein BH11PLA1_BH11PLA1_20280 [soil metagenome]